MTYHIYFILGNNTIKIKRRGGHSKLSVQVTEASPPTSPPGMPLAGLTLSLLENACAAPEATPTDDVSSTTDTPLSSTPPVRRRKGDRDNKSMIVFRRSLQMSESSDSDTEDESMGESRTFLSFIPLLG